MPWRTVPIGAVTTLTDPSVVDRISAHGEGTF
jgi:hypothetical protein